MRWRDDLLAAADYIDSDGGWLSGARADRIVATLREVAASVDTLPKGRDAKQGSVGTKGSAVGSEAGETPDLKGGR